MVHPSPPLISDHLAFLPATILTLTAALSPEDREVLAYLLSCSSDNFFGNRRNTQKSSGGGGGGKGGDHPPSFNCSCFRCYTSYWVRWDSSPNRQLIHEIIDAFEDGSSQSKKDKNKKERRKRGCNGSDELKRPELSSITKDEFDKPESADKTSGGGGNAEEEGGGGGDDEGEEEFEKGSPSGGVSQACTGIDELMDTHPFKRSRIAFRLTSPEWEESGRPSLTHSSYFSKADTMSLKSGRLEGFAAQQRFMRCASAC
ncbi:hypothetical protein F0562_014423 [Nyssa sinensis]|uniref:Uncharacterized protein n=1 Tax=Nyssa sinensis TaxID=561372 RepID=A0A5J4ZSN5_9ASTE|nr:hypothetical protein F0562_014423 [Nyssa sinensis]